MEKKQKNKLAMYNTTEHVCMENTDAWKGLPAYKTALQDFRENIVLLEQSHKVQKLKIKSKTAVKGNSEKLMIDLAERVVKSVKAYASQVKSPDLKLKVNFSASKLRNTADIDLLQDCEHIYDVALELLPHLGDFGITKTLLADYKKKVDAFSKVNSLPRVSIAIKKRATARIAELEGTIDELLVEQMDNLMIHFKVSHPAFYRLYFNARIRSNSFGSHSNPAEATEMEDVTPVLPFDNGSANESPIKKVEDDAAASNEGEANEELNEDEEAA